MVKSRISIKRDQKPKSTDDFFSNFEDNNDQLGPEALETKKEYTRQTFMIRKDQLKQLKVHVHKKKLEDYRYTQKQALETALDLLFASINQVKKRDSDEKV